MLVLFFMMRPLDLYSDVINLHSQLIIKQNTHKIVITFKLLNKGVVRAVDVCVHLRFLGEIKKSEIIESIKKGQTETVQFIFNIPVHKVGSYPLISEIQFHDNNLFPFFALHCTKIFFRTQEFDEPLTAHINNIKISDKNTIYVNIKNNKVLDSRINGHMVLSSAFVCKNDKSEIFLKNGQTKKIGYLIKNKNALMNTDHQGFFIMTYLKNNTHHTGITAFKIHVHADENDFIFFAKKYWLLGFAGITFFWILIVSIHIFIFREV
ncbi:hypothetical protein MHK_010208 [Candidatus Magnetomorum sp. HK-1]|nr:hypothetical protein MHK_010208 [Candidatus Magnetomorum sp. HK-1]